MAENQSKRKEAVHLLITGNDEFAIKQCASERVKEYKPEDEMNLETIDAQVDNVEQAVQRLEQLVEALLTIPFFGGRKLVFFKSCNFMGDTVVGRSESVTGLLARVAELVPTLNPESVQLIWSAVGVDRRKSFYKAIEKAMKVELHEMPDLRNARAEEAYAFQVEKIMKQAGLKPVPGVAERMVEVIGGDTRALHAEIEKLVLYTHPDGVVDEEALQSIVSGNRGLLVWDLNDAVTEGNTAEALHMLRQLLAQGENEVGIVIMLGQHIRLAAICTHLLETKRLRLARSGSFVNVEISPEGERLLPGNKKGEKPKPFRLARVTEKARRRPASEWFRAVNWLHDAHLQLVSSGGDKRRQLETLVLRLCRS